MRLAVSGAHVVGKSTLVEALAAVLPDHETLDEPYLQLVEEGHDFADPPSLDDFELQLARSIADVDASGPDVVLDRCPADLVAYLETHDDAAGFDADRWLSAARAAVERLDLVVFVPIEERVAVRAAEDEALRRAVDERLRALLVEGELGAETDVLEVTGSVADRVTAVVTHLRARRQ
jgi:hypothetical protein